MVEESKDPVPAQAPKTDQDNIRPGEERMLRLAKRRIDAIDRYVELASEQMAYLPPVKGQEDTVFEIIDLMRNHVDDEIGEHGLQFLLERYGITFKIYILVSQSPLC